MLEITPVLETYLNEKLQQDYNQAVQIMKLAEEFNKCKETKKGKKKKDEV